MRRLVVVELLKEFVDQDVIEVDLAHDVLYLPHLHVCRGVDHLS